MIAATKVFGWSPDVTRRQTMGDLRALGRTLMIAEEG